MKQILIYGILIIMCMGIVSAIQIPQLTYHKLGVPSNSETIDPFVFDAQMNWLYEQNFSSCTFVDYSNNLCPERSFILAFDDGNVEVVSMFKPIMDKYGFKGSLGVVTSWIGQSSKVSWNDIIQLYAGGWEITSHSVNHKRMTTMSLNNSIFEYLQSQDTIYNNTGIVPKYFVYPFNEQNSNMREECLKYYDGCTGASSYAANRYDYYLTENTSLINNGLVRIKVESTTTMDRFKRIFNYTQVLVNNSSECPVCDVCPINNIPEFSYDIMINGVEYEVQYIRK